MKNLIKRLFILNLIFTLSFPTYSAISVSDGSAFVTKAEFQKDKNNLDQRVKYIKNSLNTKIDNIVSSYLSRNGIWNREAQTLLFTSYRCGAYVPSVGTNKYYYGKGNEVQANSENVSFNNSSSVKIGKLVAYNDVSGKKLFVASKSGLAIIKLYWTKYFNDFYPYPTSYVGSYEFSIATKLTFKGENSKKSATTSNNYNYVYAWGENTSANHSYGINSNKFEILFLFVTKGDSILFNATTDVNSVSLGFPDTTYVAWDVRFTYVNVF